MIPTAVVENDLHIWAASVARCQRQSNFTAAGDWESTDDAAGKRWLSPFFRARLICDPAQ
jgi:hypothetical protein